MFLWGIMIEPRQIIKKRVYGEIRYSLVSDYSGNLDRVLAKFGLTPNKELLVEHDRGSALEILSVLLQRDMAYESPCMSEAEAAAMAESILSSNETVASKYFSNGNWAKKESWNPLTESTFDSGILVTIDKNLYFCIWFQDED